MDSKILVFKLLLLLFFKNNLITFKKKRKEQGLNNMVIDLIFEKCYCSNLINNYFSYF